MDDLEVIKENVEPLPQGRKIESLKAALSSDSIELDKRESIREKFEADIQNFKDDKEKLLETYHKYLNWIEQNYPNRKNKVGYSKNLENCIQTFYKDENYRNDERMLSIFLKYINIITDPLSVFDFFYKVGFAKKLSHFYIDWAYHLEMQKNFKKALQVLKVGIKNEAQPMTDLKRSMNDLEVRTLRHTFNNPDEPNDGRKALSKLKTHSDSRGKTLAPIRRTITETNDGMKKINVDVAVQQNEQFEIYVEEDEEPKSSEVEPKDFIDKSKENKMKIDKWCGNKLDLKKVNTKNNDKLEVFIDSNENQPPLKKEPIPVAKFESEDVLKKYIWYDRFDEIYRDGTEYSFEELRAQKWMEDKIKNQQQQQQQEANNTQFCSKESDNKFFMNETKNSSAMVRALFNGTLYNSMYQTQHFEKSKSFGDTVAEENCQIMHETTMHQDFQIMEDCDDTKANHNLTKTNEFDSCSSSTPFVNKTMKSRHNLAVRSFNNPNFVSGITSKLSTIVETSREEYSKSSSSSSGTISSVGSTTKKMILIGGESIKNPFDQNTRKSILSSILEGIEVRKSYEKVQCELPKFFPAKKFIMKDIEDQKYIIIDQIANSDSLEVFLYTKVLCNFREEDVEFKTLKVCRYTNDWEFYIYNELNKSLVQKNSFPDIELSLITLDRMIFYENGCLLFHDLDLNFSLANVLRKLQNERLKLSPILISLIMVELILIIQKLHDCGFIHSNINAENIILNLIDKNDIDSLPNRTAFIKIIDFSQAIDMRVLPDGVTFEESFKNEEFYSILNTKPWNYQIDWIGFLNCIHIMAFDSEIKIISNENNKLTLNKSFEGDLYFLNEMFSILLNLEANQKPNLQAFVGDLISYIKRDKLLLRAEMLKIF